MKNSYERLELDVISFEFADIICNSLEPDWKNGMADRPDVEPVVEVTK